MRIVEIKKMECTKMKNKKTNQQMYQETVQYFEPIAKQSGAFDSNQTNRAKCYCLASQTCVKEKIKEIFNLENKNTHDLLSLLEYLDTQTTNDINQNKATTGFLRHLMFDALYDSFFTTIHDVIQQNDPEAYKQLIQQAEIA